ncbi:MAG TPA: AI-2E family transporter YdiK [Burkholderiales bacterium]|nr:AI-2E family transporter YdiK [Burkholderiales bacterium]
MADTRHDLTLTVLAVIFLVGLIGASLWVLKPFLGALAWATMIVVATWPMMLRVEKAVGNRRWIAVTIMSLLPLVLLIVPLTAAISTILANVNAIAGWAKALDDIKVPPPPSWLGGLPFVGDSASQLWQEVATEGLDVLAAKLVPYVGTLSRHFVSEIGSFGVVFVQFLLTVLIAAILYAGGEHAAVWVRRFGARLAGRRGEHMVVLSAQAIRGVALGVVVTALVQALVGGIGLAIARVPFAAVLTAVMFLLSVAQIGAAPVMIIAVAWLYWTGAAGWGTFLLVVTVIVGTLDNFLRPILIKKGADLPLLLIFSGVIGGLIGFGLIGIFVGPMVLAVTYTLLRVWIEDGEPGRHGPRTEDGS